jgi:hypothetical protein
MKACKLPRLRTRPKGAFSIAACADAQVRQKPAVYAFGHLRTVPTGAARNADQALPLAFASFSPSVRPGDEDWTDWVLC